jgi:NAD(P)-dependent dehydrogenase (short-subunit alcohol dehydrogenase family)
VSRGAAIVTGSARGIGAVIAETLASTGRPVLLVDRDPAVSDTAAELRARGADVTPLAVDLTNQAGPAHVCAAIQSMAGSADVLVNNAGITRDSRVDSMSVDDFTAVIDVNLIAAMQLTIALADLLCDGASVINISSRAALGNFGQLNYVAAKAGLVGFTRALALDWAPRVRVNAVAPGLIESPMTESMPEHVLDRLVSSIPANRIGQPADIAHAVAFLAGTSAGYITGQVLTVCGGRSIAP